VRSDYWSGTLLLPAGVALPQFRERAHGGQSCLCIVFLTGGAERTILNVAAANEVTNRWDAGSWLPELWESLVHRLGICIEVSESAR
jgi:hypothetical protein